MRQNAVLCGNGTMGIMSSVMNIRCTPKKDNLVVKCSTCFELSPLDHGVLRHRRHCLHLDKLDLLKLRLPDSLATGSHEFPY